MPVKFWVGNLEERDYDVEERTMISVGLEEIRRKVAKWNDLAEGRQGLVAGCSESSNELSGSIK